MNRQMMDAQSQALVVIAATHDELACVTECLREMQGTLGPIDRAWLKSAIDSLGKAQRRLLLLMAHAENQNRTGSHEQIQSSETPTTTTTPPPTTGSGQATAPGARRPPAALD